MGLSAAPKLIRGVLGKKNGGGLEEGPEID